MSNDTSDNMFEEQDEFLRTKFRTACINRAKDLGKDHERLLTYNDMMEGSTGINRMTLKKYGLTFQQAKDLTFPPEDLPFDEDTDPTEATEKVAEIAEECAAFYKKPTEDLLFYELSKYAKFRYGENSKGIQKYILTHAGGFNAIRDAYFPLTATRNAVNKQVIRKHALQNRKARQENVEVEIAARNILARCETTFKRAYSIQICCRPNQIGKVNTALLGVLSDLHFGSDIIAQETGVENYGTVEESRRLARITKEIAEFDVEARPRTVLYLLINGDIIQGQLHDPRDGAVIAEQIERAIHLLVQQICWLAGHFPQVKVYIQTGNHDRITSRHKTRAVNQKWDSYLYIIGNSLKYAVAANAKNVEFFMPKTPFVTFDIMGQKIFATHGDTVLTLGHNTIPVAQLANQTTRINSTLPGDQIYDVYIAGHIHSGTFTALPNGSNLYTNPSIVPPDAFSVSLGSMRTNCGQWLIVFKEGCRDPLHRLIRVNQTDDRDASLDEIIQPWTPQEE